MATENEIKFVLDHLQESIPTRFFNTINEGYIGMGAVLQYLYEADGAVTAGDISEYMQVSTARVAVLLRKMNSQGLITKSEDAHDARVVNVKLSLDGQKKAEEIKTNIYRELAFVIDGIGMNKLSEFIEISDEIKQLINKVRVNEKK